MTYDRFLKVMLSLQKEQRVIQSLYDNGLDIADFVDSYHVVISELIKEVYGEEGYDWWSWYCYDNEYGTKGLDAEDADGSPICYSHVKLWEYLETIKTNNHEDNT